MLQLTCKHTCLFDLLISFNIYSGRIAGSGRERGKEGMVMPVTPASANELLMHVPLCVSGPTRALGN